jgi:2,5-diketo-D-gluconate reductase A
MSTAPETIHVELNDGRAMPQLGFGVFQIPPADTAAAVGHALRVGYRHVDTAAAYRNEAQVGEAIRSSGLDREAVFVTTKLWNSDQGRDAARRALEASLDRLGFDAVDLYLIHWPAPARDRYLETWETLIELQRDGLARSIGVSNFEVDHLQRIIDATGVVPAVNQIELHPRLQQRELRGFHDEHGINTTAWSPLAQGGVLGDPPIVRLAETYGKTPAQVILRWHLDLGNIVIPKSVTPKRIEENFGIFDFRLDEDAMRVMAQLDAGERIGPDPRTFTG